MFERFADEARRATAQASEEARKLGHDFIGTEHLLLGLLAGGSGPAFTVLTSLEVTLDDARMKVNERVHPYGQGSVESPPFTPLAKKVLERALREALQLKVNFIGTEHLLLGLIAVPDGGGARILVELAGNLEYLRQETLANLGPSAGGVSPGGGTSSTGGISSTGGTSSTGTSGKTLIASGALRRWATQGRTVFTRPGSTVASGGGPGLEAATVEDAPLCPSCQAPLADYARYGILSVPAAGPGDSDGGAPEGGEASEGGEEGAGGGGDSEGGSSSAAEPEETDPSISIRVVFCGRCGVALGVV